MFFVIKTTGISCSSQNDMVHLHSFDCEADADVFVAGNNYDGPNDSSSFASKIKAKHHESVAQHKATIIDNLMHAPCAICKSSAGNDPLSFKIKGKLFSVCSEKCKDLFRLDYLSFFGEDPIENAD